MTKQPNKQNFSFFLSFSFLTLSLSFFCFQFCFLNSFPSFYYTIEVFNYYTHYSVIDQFTTNIFFAMPKREIEDTQSPYSSTGLVSTGESPKHLQVPQHLPLITELPLPPPIILLLLLLVY